MKKFTLIILCFIAIAAMMSNRANAANDGDSDVMLTAVVQSTNDVSKIPVTIYLTNPSIEVASVTAVLEAPVAVSKFVYNTSEHAYSNTDRWNTTTSVRLSAGTAAYGENGFYISIMDNELTAFKGSEGPIITVYFDGSELADGSYIVKVLHTETYPSAHESNSEAKFSIRDGKVTGSNSGSTSVYRTVTYFVDGNFYATQQYKEGDNIVPIDVPVKYGYVFSGWSTIPNNMGAEDLIVTGTFTYGGYHGNEILTALVESTNDVSKIPITIYLTNPSIEVASVTAVLEAPVAVSKFVYNTSEYAYSNTDRWNLTTSATFAAGTAAYGENGFYISIMDNELTAFKGSEGPIITVYFDGSELADGSYIVKMLHTETYPYSNESNGEATFTIRNGKVIGTNGGSTSVYRTVTYFVDGNFYATQQYKEGDNIVPIDVPVKYGYVFSGWSTIPNNMGAEDLIVTGTFTYGGYHGNEILTALVESTNDVSKIPVTIYLTNPSTEIKAIEAVLEAPVAVDKFDNIAYSNTDRWNSMAEIQMAAGTENHGANGFFISILNWTGDRLTDPYAQITECSGTEGPIITVYFDGSELADGNYTVRMYDAFAVASGSSSIYSPDANIEFSIQNGKVIGTNGGSTSTLATDISLDHATLSMNIGESQKLSASIIPSEALQDVTWTSSDTKVATVSQNGVVTAIAEGTAIITATTTDSSNKEASCTITVKRNGPVLASAITLSEKTRSIGIGVGFYLSATITPSSTSQQVSWRSTETNVATVSEKGLVLSISGGETYIIATTTDGSELSDTCIVIVNWDYTDSQGLNYRFESGIYEGQGFYVVKSETATGDIVIPDILEGPNGPYGSMYELAGIDDGAFAGCTGITSITSPTSSFSAAAVTGCTGLQKIIVDDNVRYVRSEDNNCLVNNDATELFLGFDNTVIPNSVTRIGDNAFFGCTGLTSITIPSTVTSIGIGAFEGCTGLTSIKIPTSVTSIGIGAFEGCTGLTSIKIPTSVTSIGVAAFRGCTGVTSIDIPESITKLGHSTFYGCTSLTSIEIPNAVTTIDNSAFKNCTGLTSIEIPNSVTAIGNSAFEGCTDLSSATLGNSVTTIGNSAFKNCSSLASINIPASVTSFGNGIFEGCTSLPVQDGIRYADTYIAEIVDKDRTEYSIKEGTRVVNMEGCNNMVSIDLPNSVTEINFKGCTNLASVTIPNSVTSIRDNAFQGCTGLMSVTIPNSVKNIGSYAFNGCTSLTSITIPNSVTTMGHNVFSGCTGLSSISLSEALTSVIHYAFRNCTGLTSIMIPKSVTDIEPDAFSGCTNLTSMEVMGEEPYQLGGEESIFGDIFYYPAFDDYGRVDLIVPLGCADKYKNAEYWKDFRSIREKVVDPDFSYVIDENNAAVYGTNDKDATEVEIPSTVENDGKVYAVTQIAANAFANYDNLEQILIPDDVTTVGNAAFEDCNSLEYVVLPAKMEEIGDKAFDGCSSITEIRTLSPTPPAISEGTFSEETMRTATLYVPMGCVVVYENAPYWGRFAYISEKDMSDDVTTISDVSADSQATVVGIYTPSGSRLNADSVGGLGKGIYIFRYNDGKSEKVVVK